MPRGHRGPAARLGSGVCPGGTRGRWRGCNAHALLEDLLEGCLTPWQGAGGRNLLLGDVPSQGHASQAEMLGEPPDSNRTADRARPPPRAPELRCSEAVPSALHLRPQSPLGIDSDSKLLAPPSCALSSLP